jgi:hypothetical protein
MTLWCRLFGHKVGVVGVITKLEPGLYEAQCSCWRCGRQFLHIHIDELRHPEFQSEWETMWRIQQANLAKMKIGVT